MIEAAVQFPVMFWRNVAIYKRNILVAHMSATILYFSHTVRRGCIVTLHKTCYVHSKIVAFFLPMSIITLTEPDTPLNNAYHVGSFNLYGSGMYGT